MKEKILTALKNLEKERGVKILLAIESGSRAWGFPSPDSDYDVRIIYTHPTDWYLSLNEKSDIINLGVNELLDIAGWELRKFLRLSSKSNMSPFEWTQSPIVYRAEGDFRDELMEIIWPMFSPIAGMHHYLSMAKNFHFKCAEENNLKLKTWFYGLRTSMNALWILERKSVPPIVFTDSLELIADRPALVTKIEGLIERKATMDEKELFEGDDELLDLMSEIIERCKAVGNDLPGAKKDMSIVNEFFRKIIKNDA